MRKELTATEVKSVKAPGFYRAGNTLYLKVMPAGSKSWVQRITVNGGRCDIGLADRPMVHGLRFTFRDCCAETGKPREIAEAALAHVV